MSAHPLMRALWQPRLVAALLWIEDKHAELLKQGRRVAAFEAWGEILVRGIKIKARADRIDRLADGSLAIIDYKTGAPPNGKMVAKGFALQLGVIGLIAAHGGFAGVTGTPQRFEYWTLSRDKKTKQFGWVTEPIPDDGRRTGIPRDKFLEVSREYLDNALNRWILGNDPFTARLNPDLPSYDDYNQLMRLEEWVGREPAGGTP
jgi:ATP-dependent helicase/nuclease subunit B